MEHTAAFFNEGLREGYKLLAKGGGQMIQKKRLTRTMTYKLMPEHIESIRQGWSLMTADPGQEKTGVDWLRMLFELHPSTKSYYKNFR